MSTSAEKKTPEPTFVQAKPYKVDLEPGKVSNDIYYVAKHF